MAFERAFVKSDNIITYPVSNRTGIYSIQSRLTNEYNLTNSINQLKDANSFVIDYVAGDGGYVDFCMAGYYFRVKDISTFIATDNVSKFSGRKIFAHLKLVGDNITTDSGFKYYSRELGIINSESTGGVGAVGALDVDGGDQVYIFKGLEFIGIDPDNSSPKDDPSTGDYFLYILTPQRYVPQSSLIKLRTDDVHRSVIIDDGDLDA